MMEVLIATIILGMSMGIVFYSLKNIEETRCVASLKSSTVALQNAMLDVALGSPPTTRRVVYTMPSCGDKSVEAVRFVYYKERERCRLCPGQYEGCWIIEPAVYDYSLKKLYRLDDASVCVQLPADISLTPLGPPDNPECLGNQMSKEPCPKTLLNSPTCDNAKEGGVPATVFKKNAEGDGAASDSNSIWSTFGRKQGDPRTFVFELSKAVEPGLTSSIQICPSIQTR